MVLPQEAVPGGGPGEDVTQELRLVCARTWAGWAPAAAATDSAVAPVALWMKLPASRHAQSAFRMAIGRCAYCELEMKASAFACELADCLRRFAAEIDSAVAHAAL